RLEAKHVLDLRGALVAARSRATANLNLKIFRQCLKTAWVEGLISENPAARVAGVRTVAREEGELKRPFTAEELQLLLGAADDEWRGLIFAGLYTAGQRLGDVATMTASQVDLAAGVVRFRTAKTGRDVLVPIAGAWRRDLAERVTGKEPGGRLFPRAYAQFVGAGGRAGRISNSFRALLARVGLAPKAHRKREGVVTGRRRVNPLSFHSFRHTATSMLKNAGVSDAVARDLVGHESAAVSASYTHIDEATKRAAMALLPDLTAGGAGLPG
ncbi:MAG: tyrosine-type recombinase/integrase, partial [Nanoarchaeota archaeon]